jgi:SagB-type dehydrogenase family enzyme
MSVQVLFQIAEHARLTSVGSNRWTLSTSGGSTTFLIPPGELTEAFEALAAGILPVSKVEASDEGNPLSVCEQLRRLWFDGYLIKTLQLRAKTLAVLRGLGEAPLISHPACGDREFVLTQCVAFRKRGETLFLESVACGAALELTDAKLFPLPAALMSPVTIARLAAELGFDFDVSAILLGWLVDIGGASYADSSFETPGTAGWQFADQLLHARSRLGRHIGAYGATFRFRGQIPNPPAVRESYNGERIHLPLPPPSGPGTINTSLSDLMGERRSIREYSTLPPTVTDLGTFLYYSARVTRMPDTDDGETAARPYPAAGGLHELEYYVLVNHCVDLPAGMYRYNGVSHCLEKVTGPTRETRRMLQDASNASRMKGELQILIVLAARFLRIMWKYESIAYALILKNVGVAYQTMYLVATAMGLGPCALGGGNSVLFSAATGNPYWQESSVGEFLLGRPAEGVALTDQSPENTSVQDREYLQ